MRDFKFKTDTIDYLLDRVKSSGASRLRVACEEFEIEIEANPAPVIAAANAVQTPQAVENVLIGAEKSEDIGGNVMKSPIVGTFYDSPSPEKPPFVEVGQHVKKGDIVYIIESMKLMNEVKSDFSGTVTKVLVKSGESVEYGQPIMVIE